MNKIKFVLFFISFVVILSACGSAVSEVSVDSENSSSDISTGEASSEVPVNDDSIFAVLNHEPVEKSALLTYDMMNGTTTTAVSENGIYIFEFIGDVVGGIINYVDLNSHVKIPLCDRIECLHNDETCDAFVPDPFTKLNVDASGEKLIATYNTFVDDSYFTTIATMDSNGKNREILYETESGTGFPYYYFMAQIGDELFVELMVPKDDRELIYNKKIISVNLKTGEYKEYATLSDDNLMSGTYNRYLVYYRSNKSEIMFYDTVEKEEIIIEPLADADIYHMRIIDNVLFAFEKKDTVIIHKLDILTGEIVSVETDPSFRFLYAPMIEAVFEDYVVLSDTTTRRVAVNINDGSITDLTLEITGDDLRKAFVYVGGELGEDLLVIASTKARNTLVGTTDVGIVNAGGYVPVYSTMSKEDYLNNIPNYQYFTEFE